MRPPGICGAGYGERGTVVPEMPERGSVANGRHAAHGLVVSPALESGAGGCGPHRSRRNGAGPVRSRPAAVRRIESDESKLSEAPRQSVVPAFDPRLYHPFRWPRAAGNEVAAPGTDRVAGRPASRRTASFTGTICSGFAAFITWRTFRRSTPATSRVPAVWPAWPPPAWWCIWRTAARGFGRCSAPSSTI